jgi:hypothetical protein
VRHGGSAASAIHNSCLVGAVPTNNFFDCDDSDGGYAAEVNDFSELL